MQPRKPTFSDFQRLICIYAEDDIDPDHYTIWFEGQSRAVNRKPMESAADLYKRVCDTVYHMQNSPHVRRGPPAHVFAGITPTAADISHLEKEQLRQILRTVMLHGKTSKERINAAVSLAKLIGIYPPEVNHVQITFR